MIDNLDDLYKELGLVCYNLELHKMILKNLEDSKQELLAKIQDMQMVDNNNKNTK